MTSEGRISVYLFSDITMEVNRHLLSEEKWGEGSTWNDIISEGKDREKELALQNLNLRIVTKSDKAMTLRVPSEPIIKGKPPPIGYVRKLTEPNGG